MDANGNASPGPSTDLIIVKEGYLNEKVNPFSVSQPTPSYGGSAQQPTNLVEAINLIDQLKKLIKSRDSEYFSLAETYNLLVEDFNNSGGSQAEFGLQSDGS